VHATDNITKPKIVIYGAGQYGLEAARIAIAKGWPIVAALNRAGAKVGKDLGRLAGLDRDLGVLVEDCDSADYSSLDADVAIVAITDRLRQNFPAYQKLLGAGINVICHGAEAYFPQGADLELSQAIDSLAKRHNVTFTGTGIWDFSRIWSGILVAGPSTQIKSFFHKSVTDAQAANLPLMLACGVSLTQQAYVDTMSSKLGIIGGLYKLIPHHVLHALGYHVTQVTERREPVLSDTPVYCRMLDRDLEPGICLGTRIIAEVATEEGVSATTHIELRILPENETEHMIWSIDGMPASKVRVDRTHAVHTSAACLVNRVPDVIAAPAGIRLVSQLGPLMPKLAGWRSQ
jgi:4-hydroxy-tetrahydrodipicolinate reductase